MKSGSRIGESSDAYDDDRWESVSKSNIEMAKAMPQIKKLESLKSVDRDTAVFPSKKP